MIKRKGRETTDVVRRARSLPTLNTLLSIHSAFSLPRESVGLRPTGNIRVRRGSSGCVFARTKRQVAFFIASHRRDKDLGSPGLQLRFCHSEEKTGLIQLV